MKKIVSLVLTLAIVMMSMAILPVSVSAASALPITDDFNGESFDFTKWNASVAANVALVDRDTATGDKAAKMFGSYWPQSVGVQLDETITSDKINMSFDIYVPSTNVDSQMMISGGTECNDDSYAIAYMNASHQMTFAGGGVIFKATTDTWYTVDMVVDIDTLDVTATAKTADGTVVGTYSKSLASNRPNLKTTSKICFGTKYGNTNTSNYYLIDNVSISQPAPVVHELPVEDDFSGTEIDTVKWNGTNIAHAMLVDRDTATGDKAVKIHNLYSGAVFGVKLDEAITEGSINIKYDMYLPADSVDASSGKFKGEFLIYGGTEVADTSAITWLNGGTMNIPGAGGVFVPAAETWYTIDVTLDVETNKVTVKVTDGTNNWEVAGVNKYTSLASTSQILFGGKYLNVNSSPYLIDNVSITIPEPVVHELPVEDDFSGTAIDTEKWNNITGTTSQVSLDTESGAVKLYDIYENAGLGVKLDEAITEGYISIKYDITLPEVFFDKTASTSQIVVYGGSGMGDSNAITFLNPDGMTIRGVGGYIFTPVANTKYTVETIVNIETQEVTVNVTDGTETWSKTAVTTSTSLASTSNISFGGKYLNYAPKSYALIDNVVIKETEAPGPLVYELPVEDNFNGTSVNLTKWNASDSTKIALVDRDTATGDKAVKIYDIYAGAGFGVKLDEAITEGSINIKYDMYIPADSVDETTGKFKGEFLIYGGTEVKDTAAITWMNGGTMNIPGVGGVFVPQKETWYTVDVTLDVETRNVAINITDGTNNWAGAGINKYEALNETSQIVFGGKVLNMNKSSLLIDNVSIKKAEPALPVEHKLPITDDFSGASFDFAKWNGSDVNSVSLSDEAAKVYNGWGSDKGFGVKLDEAVSSGKINIKYDMYLPSTNTGYEFRLTAGEAAGDKTVLVNTDQSGMNLRGGYKFAKPSVDTWYTVDLTYDCNTFDITVNLTPRDGGITETYTGTIVDTTEVKTNSQFYFGTKWIGDDANPGGDSEYVLVDNVTISRYYETPEIAGVTYVKYDDTESKDIVSNVSAGTKEIVVTFNTPMDKDTLNGTTMTLVNTTANETVTYTGTYNDSALTWTIPLENYLAPSATYVLTMTEDAKNGAGEAASLTPWEFKTDEGEYKAVVSAYKGDTKVTKLEELATNDVITVKAEVINTTGKPQNLQLIYAGYNSNKLIAYKGFSKTIAATDKNTTVEDLTVTVDKTDMTHIRLFGWHDFKSLKVLSASETIE
ncbi:MAG: Ig-like domain-containing protein [Clostridia bacterium]|nr:Ig-like domain-containing protein [Clostridia bacterium]